LSKGVGDDPKSKVGGTAVAEVAYKQGLVTVPRPDVLAAYIKSQMYDPTYEDLS